MRVLLSFVSTLVVLVAIGCGGGPETVKPSAETGDKKTVTTPAEESSVNGKQPEVAEKTPEPEEAPPAMLEGASWISGNNGESEPLDREALINIIKAEIRRIIETSPSVKLEVERLLKSKKEETGKELEARIDKAVDEARNRLIENLSDAASAEDLAKLKEQIKGLNIDTTALKNQILEDIKSSMPEKSDSVDKEQVAGIVREELDTVKSDLEKRIEKIESEKTSPAAATERKEKIESGPLKGKTVEEVVNILLMASVGLGVLLLLTLVVLIFKGGAKKRAREALARAEAAENRARDLGKRVKDAAISFQKVSQRVSKVEKTAGAGVSGRRFQLSQEAMNRIFEDDARRLHHIFSIGESFLEMEDAETAIEWFDACLEIDPNYYPALIEKGIALAKLSQFQESIQTLNKAAQLDQSARPWYNMACVAHFMGNKSTMLQAVQEAVNRDATTMERFKHDATFSQYREDPKFLELVGG